MIFKREMLKNSKALIIWSVILSGIILMILSIYPQFSQNQESMTELLSAYPESFQKALGMDRLNMGSLIGYYGLQIHLYTTLLGSIYVVMLASSMIAKEENEKTIEFLLSKPVMRSRILTEKLLVILANILIFNTISTITSLIGFGFSDDKVPYKSFFLLVIGTILLHVSFASVGFLLSVLMKKTRTITSISLGLVFMSYFFSIMTGISEDLEPLKFASLFKYVDAGEIITQNAINPLFVVIMILLSVISLCLAYFIYQRKDIAV
ncbi:ABC transporter permease subunit [Bacillus sp. 2205SS5-2]|uniref:ABC transporter permease subunit n=1 Tax=Bacillus sp. 2205SS5-2 TaxID=3109031 RepID=UPI003004DFFF